MDGKPAFTADTHFGYKQGAILGRNIVAHRVIWAIVHGVWPDEVDHINGNRADNRLENLRAVNSSENKKNMALRSDNRTGFHGIRPAVTNGKWIAEIRSNGVRKYLGTFGSLDDAVAARKTAESALGFHENHGRAA